MENVHNGSVLPPARSASVVDSGEREREREANGRGELVSDSSFVRNVRMRGM